MNEPWKEDWCVGFRSTGDISRDGHLVCRVRGVGTVLSGGTEWDARLAAAAPEMARVLIEVFNTMDGPLVSKAADALERAGVITVTRARLTNW